MLLKHAARELLYTFSPDDLDRLNRILKTISCDASQARASRRIIEQSIHWALENGTKHVQPYAILFQNKLATPDNIDWMQSDTKSHARCAAITAFQQKGLFTELLWIALKSAPAPERFQETVILLNDRGFPLTHTIIEALSRMTEETMGNLQNILNFQRQYWQPDNNPDAIQNLELLLQGPEPLREVATQFILFDTAAVNHFFQTYQNLPPADQTNQRYLQAILHEMYRQANPPALPVDLPAELNPSQSTHTKSVHITVSASASKLKNQYGSILAEHGLESVLDQLKEFVKQFCKNNKMTQQKRDAIDHFVFGHKDKRAVLDAQNTSVDPLSKVSLLELTGLIWLALTDDANRTVPLENAQEALMNGFYESQRQYNLDEGGKDNGRKKERTSCSGGIFNNLVNHMQGILPQCNVRYATEATVALKARALVRETFLAHAEHRIKNMHETNDIQKCLEWIQNIQQEGINDALLPEILDTVLVAIQNEFSEPEDDHLQGSFKILVDIAIESFELHPVDIETLHTSIQTSALYRMHERQLMQANVGLFGRMSRNITCKPEQSHDSANFCSPNAL